MEEQEKNNLTNIFQIPMQSQLLKEMEKLSVEERMHQYQIREDRADVIVPALNIFNNVMTWADIKHIYVPKISVADGLVHSIYTKVTGQN